jgi:hypothetical protein
MPREKRSPCLRLFAKQLQRWWLRERITKERGRASCLKGVIDYLLAPSAEGSSRRLMCFRVETDIVLLKHKVYCRRSVRPGTYLTSPMKDVKLSQLNWTGWPHDELKLMQLPLFGALGELLEDQKFVRSWLALR